MIIDYWRIFNSQKDNQVSVNRARYFTYQVNKEQQKSRWFRLPAALSFAKLYAYLLAVRSKKPEVMRIMFKILD